MFTLVCTLTPVTLQVTEWYDESVRATVTYCAGMSQPAICQPCVPRLQQFLKAS